MSDEYCARSAAMVGEANASITATVTPVPSAAEVSTPYAPSSWLAL
jgi:hypothetical protein